MTLGIAITTRADLGISPIASLPYVISLHTQLSFGAWIFIVNFIFFTLEIVLLGKAFPRLQFLQIIPVMLMGVFTDFSMMLTQNIHIEGYLKQLIYCIAGTFIISFGVYLTVIAKLVLNPGEGLVKTIALKAKQLFGNVKIIFDCSLVSLSVLLSWLIAGQIDSVREGTLIGAVLIGLCVKWLMKHVQLDRFY
ncbi:MAG: DUF6198 family protein [Neisseria sp.]